MNTATLPASTYVLAASTRSPVDGAPYEAVAEALDAYLEKNDPDFEYRIGQTPEYVEMVSLFLKPYGWTFEQYQARIAFETIICMKAARDEDFLCQEPTTITSGSGGGPSLFASQR